MEEKRDQEEFKHVCRLCNKRYPSGKSLGGHMRSHVIANNNSYHSSLTHKVKQSPNHNHHTQHSSSGHALTNNNDRASPSFDHPYSAASADRHHQFHGGGGGGSGGGGGGYGLRENPKKTWRMVDSATVGVAPVKQDTAGSRVCKQCGKGFQSLKALCGHMSCHSDRERNFAARSAFNDEEDEEEANEDDDDGEDDDNSWAGDEEEEEEEEEVEVEEEEDDEVEMTVESQSDNHNNNNNNNVVDGSAQFKRSSTKGSFYRAASTAMVNSFSPPGSNNVNVSGGASSSNNSEIDQHEQEEVALSLMMLSRDSSGSTYNHNHNHNHTHHQQYHHHQHINNFAAESSDNNSVILEGGSSSTYAAAAAAANRNKNNNNKNKHFSSVSNINANEDYGVKPKLKVVADSKRKLKCVEMDNSDSGYFENGAKELESDDSVDGYARNYGFKNPKFESSRSGYVADLYDSEHNRGVASKFSLSKFNNSSSSNNNNNNNGAGGSYYNNSAQKKARFSALADDEADGVAGGGSSYLNGNGYLRARAKAENGGGRFGTSLDQLYDKAAKANKIKSKTKPNYTIQAPSKGSHKGGKYECSICSKTFKTHQALGGHIITHKKNNNNGGFGSESRHDSAGAHVTGFASQRLGMKSDSFAAAVRSSKNVVVVDKTNNNNKISGSNNAKKTKGHKCPFCPKVFRSGQALGGHKRSHLIGCNAQDRANLIQSAQENPPDHSHHPLLDLNLPPQDEGEAVVGPPRPSSYFGRSL